MIRISANEIEKAMGGKIIQGNAEEIVTNPVLDSREAKAESIMFCIKGEKTDGHNYIPSAAQNGCKVFVVETYYKTEFLPEHKDKVKECTFIEVSNVKESLQKFARWYIENRLNLKKTIAVTGSVGKTSTRDMLFAALNTKYVAGKNMKNYNSDLGLPITILSFDEKTEVAVLEMGMDDFGQIHQLVNIARPDIAVITNIGMSHMEILKSQEGILKAKMEITDFFTSNNVLIYNGNDLMLTKTAWEKGIIDGKSYKVIEAGTFKNNPIKEQFRGFIIDDVKDKGDKGISFKIETDCDNIQVNLSSPGAHNAVNACLALQVADLCGVDLRAASKALENAERTGNRLRILEKGGIKVIDDSYNAAPASMMSAIATLTNSEAKRRIAILGDMNELGTNSREEHKNVGIFAMEKGIDILITVGEKAKDIAEGAKNYCANKNIEKRVLSFEKREDLNPVINGIIEEGDCVLLKASRSLELENLTDIILKG